MQHDKDNIETQFSEAVLGALNQGRKITAIKLLREERGLGLKEAKQAIDRLERARRGDAVDHPAMQEYGGGKLVVRLVIALILVVVIYRFFFQS
jgi:hypothetical protein